MNSQTLAIIWFAIAATLGIGEILIAGSFYLAPFGVGALAAAITAALGGGGLSFLVFVVVSVVAFLALRPLSRKLDKNATSGLALGAERLMESEGTVIEAIPAGPGEAGMIKIGSETWRAESHDNQAIKVGAVVNITEVTGTRLTVKPKTTEQGA